MDYIEGEGEHNLCWFFHLAPGLSVERDETSFNSLIIKISDSPYVKFCAPSDVQLNIQDSWYSAQYAYKEVNPCLVALWDGPLPEGKISFNWKINSI